MPFHVIAILPGGKQKTLSNRSEDKVLADIVIPFVLQRPISANWGSKEKSYQALDLKIYETKEGWDRKNGSLPDFVKNKKNKAPKFIEKAKNLLSENKAKVFIVMPIQGDKQGNQEAQRVYREYDERFTVIQRILQQFDAVAIRIDREYHMGDLVSRIKSEIASSLFVVADLTDERPSCYFEAGYAEALKKPIIYIASKDSIVKPGSPTKIHFDIHANINFFSNHVELGEKVKAAIEKNRDRIFRGDDTSLSAA